VLLAGSSQESFWVAHRTRYVIERWSATGMLMATLVRHVPWFPDRDWEMPVAKPGTPSDLAAEMQLTALKRMNALFKGMKSAAVDSSNRIWYKFFAIDHPIGGGNHIEVVDGNTGGLIARLRSKNVLPGLIDGHYSYSPGAEPDGTPFLTIYRQRITGLPPRQ
jgi:hypothetical protein